MKAIEMQYHDFKYVHGSSEVRVILSIDKSYDKEILKIIGTPNHQTIYLVPFEGNEELFDGSKA